MGEFINYWFRNDFIDNEIIIQSRDFVMMGFGLIQRMDEFYLLRFLVICGCYI